MGQDNFKEKPETTDTHVEIPENYAVYSIIEDNEHCLDLRVDWTGVLSYSLTQSGIPLVDSISMRNLTTGLMRHLKVQITFENDFVEPLELMVDRLESGEKVDLSPRLRISAKKIFELTERVDDRITMTFSGEVQAFPKQTDKETKDEADDLPEHIPNEAVPEPIFLPIELSTQSSVMPILPTNQWSGSQIFPESIAGFVLPNIPQITTLQARATQILKEMSGRSSFEAYYAEDKNVVRQQLAAIYATIYEQNISYAVSPASFDLGQRVRLPHDVLSGKIGNCIEMSVLYSSLCEAFGLHSFIILIKGHAFVGAWLVDQVFENNVMYDVTEIRKRLVDGINDLELLEATCLNSGSKATFEQATRRARDLIENEDEFECVVDVYRSHRTGVRPLPVRIVEDGETKIIDFGLADDADATAKIAKSVEEHFLDITQQDEVDKRTIWMRNLLDLSKRNALISFRPGPKTIQLFVSNLAQLEDTLSQGEAFTLREASNEWAVTDSKIDFNDIESRAEFVDKISALEFKARRLRTFLTPAALEKTAKTLYREAKKALEENGSNTLYLAMGFLRWIDPKDPQSADGSVPLRYAPLILIPVDLTRSTKGAYQISLRDEDAQMNITLLEMLRQTFNIRIGGLNPLPLDEHGVDLDLVLNSMRRAVLEMEGWDVINMACLGLFSFSQFVMWNDLRTRFSELTKNKVVKALTEGLYLDHPADDLTPKMLDNETNVSDVVIPSSVDSSQLAAIVEATKGRSFVLHGPPGTGKSQTITNMIANAIYQQKSIIFVAEKMAALDVVQQRLSAIGLGDYCLELHSNKTQKKVLLDKLEKSLSLTAMSDNPTFEHKAEEIQAIKSRLNRTIDGLHQTHSHGYSVYDLIGIYTQQGKVTPTFRFTPDQVAAMTPVSLSRQESAVRDLGRSLSHLSTPYYDHPLRTWRKDAYTLHADREVEGLLTESLTLVTALQTSLAALESEYQGTGELLARPGRLLLLKSLMDVLRDRNLKTTLTEVTFRQLIDPDLRRVMAQTISDSANYVRNRTVLLKRYGTSVDNYDVVEGKRRFLEASGSLLLKGRNIRNALQDLNSHTRGGFTVTGDNALTELEALATSYEARIGVQEKIDALVKLFGITVPVHPDDVDAIEDLATLADRIEELSTTEGQSLKTLFGLYELIQAHQYDLPNPLVPLAEHEASLESKLSSLESMTGADCSELLQTADWLSTLAAQLETWRTHLDQWRSWSAFYGSLDQLSDAGLDNVIQGLWASQLTSEDDLLLRTYRADLARDLIRYHLAESPNLSRFNGLSFEGQIEEYNRLVDAFEKLCQEQIRIKLSQNLPTAHNTTVEEQRELANLTRVIRSKGRGASIRSIFSDSGQVIRRMTPVFLMSPLSVAQYIDPSSPPFDLVIFDEASQIRTSVAIGAMSRAHDCIIVGDPNQMPPTSFFTSQTIDEDNLQLEALESLLEDCLAINMPQRYLSWHYRSQSESLITFSNHMYYGGKMKTFPSPFDRLSRVKYCKVDGIYDRGSSRTNKVEAEAIVAELVRRLLDPELVKDSIGVVTFNIQQQNLIDDLFQARVRKDATLASIVEKLEEPLFIKNLENVQGDERDVIIFSVCFGPDSEGKISSNFGPLNRKGGWRRLNVAVSRARKAMAVYTSLEPHEIVLRSTSADGVVGLRRFMEFAQMGHISKEMAEYTNRGTLSEDALIPILAEFLKGQGYEVDTNVGDSGIRMDIAIIDPENPGYYLAAIRLDGKQYAGSETARDRNRLMPSVLKVRGWNVYSLWTLDWYDNQAREEARLLDYLEQLKESERPELPVDAELTEESSLEVTDDGEVVSPSTVELEMEIDIDSEGFTELEVELVDTSGTEAVSDDTSESEAVAEPGIEAEPDVELGVAVEPRIEADPEVEVLSEIANDSEPKVTVVPEFIRAMKAAAEPKPAVTPQITNETVSANESQSEDAVHLSFKPTSFESTVRQVDASSSMQEASNSIVSSSEVKPQCQIYVKYFHPETYDSAILQQNPKVVTEMMEAIITVEAPLRTEELFYRVLEAYPGARLTKNAQAFLQTCLGKAKKKTSKQGDSTFYWVNGFDPNSYLTYRLPEEGEKRELDTISDYELANLLWDIVLEQRNQHPTEEALTEDELIKRATRQLGFVRYTDRMHSIIKTAVTNAIRRKILKRDRKYIVVVEVVE